jgi:hypothetical protein
MEVAGDDGKKMYKKKKERTTSTKAGKRERERKAEP